MKYSVDQQMPIQREQRTLKEWIQKEETPLPLTKPALDLTAILVVSIPAFFGFLGVVIPIMIVRRSRIAKANNVDS